MTTPPNQDNCPGEDIDMGSRERYSVDPQCEYADGESMHGLTATQKEDGSVAMISGHTQFARAVDS